MMRLTARLLAALALAAGTIAGNDGCAVARGPKITAGELAQVAPALGRLPAAAEFGYSPAPGMTRVIRAQELRRFAGRDGITGGVTAGACELPFDGAETTGGAFFGGGVLAQPAKTTPLASAIIQFEMRISLAPEFESKQVTSRGVHVG